MNSTPDHSQEPSTPASGRPERPIEPMKQIAVEQLHKDMRAQGVSSSDHVAFVCVMCGHVQSITSFTGAGADSERAEKMIGFSCVGRIAGPKHQHPVWGDGPCNWTLGGLFRLHNTEVITEDGETHPSFALATPEQAQQLEASHAGEAG